MIDPKARMTPNDNKTPLKHAMSLSAFASKLFIAPQSPIFNIFILKLFRGSGLFGQTISASLPVLSSTVLAKAAVAPQHAKS
jgi:hypothetical protein